MIKREYTALICTPGTKNAAYVGKFDSLQELNSWHQKHVVSGKFNGLELVIQKKFKLKRKPTLKDSLLFVYSLLFIYLVYRLTIV